MAMPVAAQATTPDPNATTTAGPTQPPPTTTTAAPDSDTPVSDELDVRFELFCDDLAVRYLALFAEVTGVPVARFVPLKYGRALAVEFGTQYVFSVRVAARTNRTTDTLEPPEVAERLERELQRMIAASDARVVQRTIVDARRVTPEARRSERGSLSVNYVWVAFLLLAVVMLGVSAMVLMRQRSSTEGDEDVGAALDEEVARPIPKDEVGRNEETLLRLVERAEASRREREAEERAAARYARTPHLFISALEADHRLRLPPPTTVPDPLAPRLPDATGAGGGEKRAATASLSSAAQKALNELHEEMAADGGDGDADDEERAKLEEEAERQRAAAQEAKEAALRRRRQLREELAKNQLMDVNDDDL